MCRGASEHKAVIYRRREEKAAVPVLSMIAGTARRSGGPDCATVRQGRSVRSNHQHTISMRVGRGELDPTLLGHGPGPAVPNQLLELAWRSLRPAFLA